MANLRYEELIPTLETVVNDNKLPELRRLDALDSLGRILEKNPEKVNLVNQYWKSRKYKLVIFELKELKDWKYNVHCSYIWIERVGIIILGIFDRSLVNLCRCILAFLFKEMLH